jgi:zinc/manganese transport system substrate-binding protein
VVRVRATAVAAIALAALALTACAGPGRSTDQPVISSGDAAQCPGEVLDVVVSVSQWSDLVQTLGGACASVTTVLASGSVDPHDFEPRPRDIAAFDGADLVVLNGAGYDTWAADAVATLDGRPAVVTAAAVAGLPADGPADPHLWYAPDLVPQIAAAVTARLTRLAPDDAAVFTAQAARWDEDLAPYRAELAALTAVAPGRTYAATETVFDRTARAIGLTDVTPEGFRSAVSNESDPAPGDIAALESALRDHRADVLVFNTQTEGSVPEQLRRTAEEAGVPVVEVTESPSHAGSSFVSWQLAQLQQLSTALTGSP